MYNGIKRKPWVSPRVLRCNFEAGFVTFLPPPPVFFLSLHAYEIANDHRRVDVVNAFLYRGASSPIDRCLAKFIRLVLSMGRA